MWIVYNMESRNCHRMIWCTCTSETQWPTLVTGVREYHKSNCRAGGYLLEYNDGMSSMGGEWFHEVCPTCQHYTGSMDYSTNPPTSLGR